MRTMPGRWLAIRIRAPSAELAGELAAGLVSLGGSAVHEQDDRLTTHVPEPPDTRVFLERARSELDAIAGRPVELESDWLSDDDWVARWRRGVRARRIGRRLVVHPPWERPAARPGDLPIAIEPGLAFGTAEHASTRGALRLLERAVRPGDRVLDVGTGNGILAIAAARLGAAEVLAADDDADAIPAAGENLDRNRVADLVRLERRTVDPAYLAGHGTGRFDVVAANVLSGVLRPLLHAFHAALAVRGADRHAGRLILAGILEEEAAAMRAAAARADLREAAADLEDGWWAGLFERDG